jgi:hypothetical protein
VEQAISRHDIVVASVTDRSNVDRNTIPAAVRTLIEAAPRWATRRTWAREGIRLNCPPVRSTYWAIHAVLQPLTCAMRFALSL